MTRTTSTEVPHELSGGTPEMWDEHLDDHATSGSGNTVIRELVRAALQVPGLQSGSTVVELGCGASKFLPPLAATGAAVAGVDFVPRGVELAREALRTAGMNSDGIVLGRIEDYVREHVGEFDVVVSFGLVEHFTDLDSIIRHHFIVAKPGGSVFVTAPNLSGLNLRWLRFAAPGMFTWHRPISAKQVAEAMRRAGASNVVVSHLGGPRLFASPASAGGPVRRAATTAVRKLVNGASEVLFRLSTRGARSLSGSVWSPFFAVSATRQTDLEGIATSHAQRDA